MTFVVKGEELRMNLRFQACITERMIMPLTSLGRRLSETRERTRNLVVPSWICFHCVTRELHDMKKNFKQGQESKLTNL